MRYLIIMGLLALCGCGTESAWIYGANRVDNYYRTINGSLEQAMYESRQTQQRLYERDLDQLRQYNDYLNKGCRCAGFHTCGR